uniref:AT-rich interactive domain-containing protein 3 n=1 Tax=Chrysemys picta bellii TaxID=8478 RepID=A0A8C3F6G6_CHRPI
VERAMTGQETLLALGLVTAGPPALSLGAPPAGELVPQGGALLGREGSLLHRQGSVLAWCNNWKEPRRCSDGCLYELDDDPKRKEFLDDLFGFMQKRGTPVNRIPIMAKQVLDLYTLYRLVTEKGGLVEVINKKIWREITKGLNLPTSITSAAFTLRTQYMKYLYPYECEKRALSSPGELQAAIDSNRREGRRQSFGTALFSYSPVGTPAMLGSPKIPVPALAISTHSCSQMSQVHAIKKGGWGGAWKPHSDGEMGDGAAFCGTGSGLIAASCQQLVGGLLWPRGEAMRGSVPRAARKLVSGWIVGIQPRELLQEGTWPITAVQHSLLDTPEHGHPRGSRVEEIGRGQGAPFRLQLQAFLGAGYTQLVPMDDPGQRPGGRRCALLRSQAPGEPPERGNAFPAPPRGVPGHVSVTARRHRRWVPALGGSPAWLCSPAAWRKRPD